MQFARYFRLSDAPGAGVRCDESGLWVGETPLLERAAGPDGRSVWRSQPLADLDRDLGKAYGQPVAFAAKLGGLTSVARALDRGDFAHAQVAALLLRLPDPPEVAASRRASGDGRDLAAQLKFAGVLAASIDEGGKESNRIEKYNPYHDERGRFTDAADAVSESGARAMAGARDAGAPDAPPRANPSVPPGASKPAAETRVALVQRLSCLDAFRACVRDSNLSSGRSTAGCTAAWSTCRSTGLPTIFAPGLVGQVRD